jgi:signal transduction histidine kinase
MIDAGPSIKRHRVARLLEMTAPRAIWIVLASLAAAWALFLHVPLGLSLGVFGCAVLPPLVGTFVRGSATVARTAELESMLWIVLATAGAASTGGVSSSLIVLFAVGVAVAWMAGGARLTLEAAAFALLGLTFAAIASNRGSWLTPQDASAIEMAYGVCGVAMVGVMAVLTARRAVQAPVLVSPTPRKPGPDRETDLKLKLLETRTRKAELGEQQARAEAQAANARLEARTTFFAQTSHELRTPLNAILGFAEMMRNSVFGPLPDRYQEYAGLIHEGGRNLSLIVDDVLDLARLEAGRYEIHREIVSLTDLAAEAVQFMRDEATRKSIKLELGDEDDAEAFADSKAVRQIALNLISNALKFTPAGGLVTVSAMEVRGGALLAVSDTGAGISPEELTRLSRAFEQGEAGKRQKGAGLGLSVVRAFAELHGGRLDIESREGGGTAIAVFFPEEPKKGG